MRLTASVLLLLLIGFMQWCCACDSCQFKKCALGLRTSSFLWSLKQCNSSDIIYYGFLLEFCTNAIHPSQHQSFGVVSVSLSDSLSYPLHLQVLIPASISSSTSLSLGLVAAGGCSRSVTRCRSCQSVCACACTCVYVSVERRVCWQLSRCLRIICWLSDIL